MTPMPNAPRTPLRSFRIPDDLYTEAQQIAATQDESVSDVVRQALERYVKAGRRRARAEAAARKSTLYKR